MSNISPSYKIPGLFITVGFGQGALSPLNAPRKVLIADYGTTEGSVSSNVSTVLFNADDAAAKFGPGSHIHRGALAFFEEHPEGTLYGLRYAEGAGTAAEYTITIATNAGSTGAYFIDINGITPVIEVPVTSGNDPTTQATAGAAAITARKDLPVTATSAAGVITLVWKHLGARGNQGKIRVSSNVAATTYVVAQTVQGATDGNPSTALDTIQSTDFDFIVTGANVTSSTTGLTAFVNRVVLRAGALIGLRGQCIGAHNGTYGDVTALALAQNQPRAQVVWCRDADLLTVEMAAKMGAVRAREEGIDPAVNLDYVAFKSWRGPFSASDKITIPEASGGLNNGVTSIIDGKIIRSITTRFQDAVQGPDYRVLDTAKVSVPDYIADVLASDWAAKGYQNWKARQDSTDQKVQDKVLTPIIVKDWILTHLFTAQDQRPIVLEGVDALRDSVIVTLGSVVPGRFDGDVPLNVIEGAHQFDLGIHQIG